MGGGVVVVLSPRSNEAKLRTLVGICSADHAKRFNTRQNDEGGEEWYHFAHPQTTEMTLGQQASYHMTLSLLPCTDGSAGWGVFRSSVPQNSAVDNPKIVTKNKNLNLYFVLGKFGLIFETYLVTIYIWVTKIRRTRMARMSTRPPLQHLPKSRRTLETPHLHRFVIMP